MADERTVGWFVEIPRSLRDEFDRLYPGKRHKKILTITAIQRALRVNPTSLHNLYREGRKSDLEPSEVDVPGGGPDASGSEEVSEGGGDGSDESSALIGRFRAERPEGTGTDGD